MNFIKLISKLILPCILLLFLISGVRKKVDVFNEFSRGIKESINTSLNIFPSVAGIMVAIAMMRASGVLDMFTRFLTPFFDILKIPSEIIPIALLRPLSGSGGIAMLTDIIENYGADSLTGIIASVICGATETTFYTIAVYFGAVGITRTKHTVKSALIADFVSIIVAILVCKIMYG